MPPTLTQPLVLPFVHILSEQGDAEDFRRRVIRGDPRALESAARRSHARGGKAPSVFPFVSLSLRAFFTQ